MKRLNRLWLVAGLAVMTLAVASCGGDNGATVGEGEAAPEDVAGSIDYWNYFAADIERVGLEEAVDSFEDAYPDASVRPEGIPLGDYMQRIVSASEANALPHTGMLLVGTEADVVQMGVPVDITDRVQAWEGYDDIPDALWDAAVIDDRIYGIPMFAFVGWMYYRVDWFEELGLEPPTTWEEFEEAAIALTDPSQGRYGFGMRGGAGGDIPLVDVIESFGGVLVDDNGQPALDRDILIEALDFYSRLHTEHGAVPPSVAEDSFGQLMAAFKTGQTAMLFHHTGSFIEISEVLEPGTEFLTAPLPSGPSGTATRISAQINSIMSEEHVETSWAWLTHLATPETQLQMRETVGLFPSRTTAANDPIVRDDLVYAAAAEIFEEAPPPTSFVGIRSWGANYLLPAFQRVLTGTSTVEEAADDILEGLERETS